MAADTDLVSPELRAVEQHVDSAFTSNPLVQQPLTVAHWYALAFLEERVVKNVIQKGAGNDAEEAAFVDSLIVNLKWPMLWLLRTCAAGGEVPRRFDGALYDAAWKLSDFSPTYTGFETVFTYATMGLATLTLEKNKITVAGAIREDAIYEAYDRIVIREPQTSLVDSPTALAFLREISALVRVREDRFDYRVEPRMFVRGLDAFDSIFSPRFSLPRDWDFQGFCMGDFSKVAKALLLLGHLHFWARLTAASNGCVGLGILDGVLVMSEKELLAKLRRYTGVSEAAITKIVRAMTYNEMEQKNPDPALQPIVRLGEHLGLSPNLLMNSAMERNFAVLLNRVPELRDDYARLSRGRETVLREKMKSAFEALGLRCWHGTVPEWAGAGEIDLIVEDPAAKVGLLMELKSFIDPSEPREVKEKSEEIKRGIEQINARRERLGSDKTALVRVSGISHECDVHVAVVSETSIGAVYVQDAAVAVVRASHLLSKISSSSLRATCEWLDERAYLPKERVHFNVVPVTLTAAGWDLEFYALEPLVDRLE